MKKYLTLILSILTIIIYPTVAEAREFNNKNSLVNVTLENGPQFYPGNSIKVRMEFDLTGQDVRPEDALVLDLPSGLEVDKDTVINFTDDVGKVLATGKIVGNKIVITFTDRVESKEQIHGFIDVSLKMMPGSFPLGKNIIDFETKGGNVPIEIEIVERIDDISKKGKKVKLSDGSFAIQWTMVVNRNNLHTNNMVLSDIIQDDGLTYVKGSTQVYIGEWVDFNKSAYKRKNLLTEGIDYKLIETLEGINLLFNPGQDMYIVDMLTQVNDPQSLDKVGTRFKNTAKLTWIDEEGNNSSSSVSSRFVVRDNNSGIGGTDKEPIEPEQPVEPEKPIEPEQPVEPEKPTEPEQPVEPNEHPGPIQPIIPKQPKEIEKNINIDGLGKTKKIITDFKTSHKGVNERKNNRISEKKLPDTGDDEEVHRSLIALGGLFMLISLLIIIMRHKSKYR
ncbi:Ig-like domain-containing protein [Lactococcus petauri]|uniref:Ig-like domain-containing protein n=1 Tax=Lactococcus petauri TaxID=1940789 RepID=UPI003854F46F